jgi:transketolase
MGVVNRMDDKIATRQAFGDTLLDVGSDPKIVVVSCDLSGATGTKSFGKKYPERFFEVGIAEQNGMGIAAGLAMEGFRPFISSFGAFITRRAYDQIMISAAYSNAGIVIVGTHSGLAIGKDGATQMGINDLSLMLNVPNVRVFQPADAIETKEIVKYLADADFMAYLRLSRKPQPNILPNDYKFTPNKLATIKDGTDIIILATGDCVLHSYNSALELDKLGISTAVLNASTLKPFDKDTLMNYSSNCKGIVTVEDHSISGGLGTLVAETLAEKGCDKKLLKIGIGESFGESGKPEDLYKKYKLDQEGIVDSIKKFYEPIRDYR